MRFSKFFTHVNGIGCGLFLGPIGYSRYGSSVVVWGLLVTLVSAMALSLCEGRPHSAPAKPQS